MFARQIHFINHFIQLHPKPSLALSLLTTNYLCPIWAPIQQYQVQLEPSIRIETLILILVLVLARPFRQTKTS